MSGANDWRSRTLARVRALIKQADPNVVEELKWRKPSNPNPSRIFNAGLEGNARRAIDLREGDKLDEEAFKALARAAVALNTSR